NSGAAKGSGPKGQSDRQQDTDPPDNRPEEPPPVTDDADGDVGTKCQSIKPAAHKAYLSFEYAESKAGKCLKHRDAYDLIKEEGIPEDKGKLGELIDYELPDYNTWTRYLRQARNVLSEQKNTPRGGRQTRKSIVRCDQVEHPKDESK